MTLDEIKEQVAIILGDDGLNTCAIVSTRDIKKAYSVAFGTYQGDLLLTPGEGDIPVSTEDAWAYVEAHLEHFEYVW